MDRRKRELGRSNDAGDVEQQTKHLRELMRSGDIEKKKVEFAAFLGYQPAKLVLSSENFVVPTFNRNQTYQKKEEFFGTIVEKFGKEAYFSMFTELLEVAHDFYRGIYEIEGKKPNPAINKSIDLLKNVLNGKDALDVEISALIAEINEMVQDRGYNFSHANVTNDGRLGFSVVGGVMGLLRSIVQKDWSEETGTDYRYAYNSLAFPYFESQIPTEELLSKVSPEVRENIKRINHISDSNERHDAVELMILGMMKKGGLKWALKDVK